MRSERVGPVDREELGELVGPLDDARQRVGHEPGASHAAPSRARSEAAHGAASSPRAPRWRARRTPRAPPGARAPRCGRRWRRRPRRTGPPTAGSSSALRRSSCSGVNSRALAPSWVKTRRILLSVAMGNLLRLVAGVESGPDGGQRRRKLNGLAGNESHRHARRVTSVRVSLPAKLRACGIRRDSNPRPPHLQRSIGSFTTAGLRKERAGNGDDQVACVRS